MRLPLRERPADIEHLVMLAVIAGWVTWFLRDAVRASPSIENLMLIGPAAALALGLCLLLAVQSVIGPRFAPGETPPAAIQSREGRTLTFIALFAAYIGGLAYVAFDLSTFAFVLVSLLLLGERNRLLAVGYSAVFTLFVTAALKEMVPFPFPTLLM
ncbi:MAG: hypothetical protein ACK4QW_04335 [Alphaproteobacteria bacterium]